MVNKGFSYPLEIYHHPWELFRTCKNLKKEGAQISYLLRFYSHKIHNMFTLQQLAHMCIVQTIKDVTSTDILSIMVDDGTWSVLSSYP